MNKHRKLRKSAQKKRKTDMDERSDQEDLTCGEAVEIGKELSENLWFNGSMKLERSMKKRGNK